MLHPILNLRILIFFMISKWVCFFSIREFKNSTKYYQNFIFLKWKFKYDFIINWWFFGPIVKQRDMMRWRISKQRRAAAKRMCGYLRFLLYVVVVACAQLLREMVGFFSFFSSSPLLLGFFLCLSWQDYLCCEEINYRERAKHRIAWYVGSQTSDGP